MEMQWALNFSTRFRSRDRNCNIMVGMGSRETRELGSGVGDNGGDNDKRVARSIKVGR